MANRGLVQILWRFAAADWLRANNHIYNGKTGCLRKSGETAKCLLGMATCRWSFFHLPWSVTFIPGHPHEIRRIFPHRAIDVGTRHLGPWRLSLHMQNSFFLTLNLNAKESPVTVC